MKCCSIKTLSYISASVLLTGVVCFLTVMLCGLFIDPDNFFVDMYKNPEDRYILYCLFPIVIVLSPLLVLLILGLKQNRIKFVGIFLHYSHALMIFTFLTVLLKFIMGFVRKESYTHIFGGLFEEFAVVVCEILIEAPIAIHHRRMHEELMEKTSHNEANGKGSEMLTNNKAIIHPI